MMHVLKSCIPIVVTVLLTSTGAFADEPPQLAGVKRIGADPATGIAAAVIVDNLPLAHTCQICSSNLGRDASGKDAAKQSETVLLLLDAILRQTGSSLRHAVKLNVYVANPKVTAAIQPVLQRHFVGDHSPAVSFVQSRLPVPEALVAMDAVATAAWSKSETRVTGTQSDDVLHREQFLHVTNLPRGSRAYISGQAENGASLREATAKTLQSLKATLEQLGCDLKDVVQVKCFLTPIDKVRETEIAICEFFGPKRAPPCVFVEWQSSLPIEIELIAAAPDQAPAKDSDQAEENRMPLVPLEFITPKGMTPSPVFCRVVRVNDPRTIFVSGLFAKDATDGAGQVTQVFDQLQNILKASGSDLRHLAKATYYVSDQDASAKLNELRPKYYDPQRPPAASKAQVLGVGVAGKSLTLDMIAVPK
jgi:enamine deaminase RidA (YjgF/YER057c/UK114 family)